jgi:hypothetical protein
MKLRVSTRQRYGAAVASKPNHNDLSEAIEDDRGQRAREDVCRALAPVLRTTGDLLWVGGYMIGSDRKEGLSPFGFGSDAAVGLALVAQIASELVTGATSLLDADNMYSAAALLRQVVEIEYLAWAFAEKHDEAAAWLKATETERQNIWQPRYLRDRADGLFKRTDYKMHCERGGHPTLEATMLLKGHSRRAPAALWWLDLAQHGVSAWGYVEAAARALGYQEQLATAADARELPNLIAAWERDDNLRGVAAKLG